MAGDFPVQMEAFPAADEEAFDLIKSLLSQCDYYVLIIGGRYGTLADDHLSYTHKEFRYAVSQSIPVLLMLHGDRGKIAAEKIEQFDEGRRRLVEFIAEASQGRTRTTWTTVGDLKAAVLAALVHAKQTKPRVGWIRGDAVASIEALEELNEVRKENAKFREALGTLEVDIPHIPLPAIHAGVEIDFMGNRPDRMRGFGSSGTISTTWMALFPLLHPNLVWSNENYNDGYWIDENTSCVSVGSALVQEVMEGHAHKFFRISLGSLRKLIAYYIEAGLMNPQTNERPFTEVADRLARRQHFMTGEKPPFRLSRGRTEITPQEPAFESGGMDDDIPF